MYKILVQSLNEASIHATAEETVPAIHVVVPRNCRQETTHQR